MTARPSGFRLIYQRYLALGSVPGCPFTRGALYTILQNRIYLGEIVHKGTAYPGEHEALLEPATVQSGSGTA